MSRRQAVTGPTGAKLSHVGLHVRDLSRMTAFYAKVLGLGISGCGVSPRQGLELAFLTGDLALHHQLALVAVGGTEAACRHLDHLAFEMENLTDLRRGRDSAAKAGAIIRTSDHGNAWAIYVTDPEGNGVEVFATSPFQMQQPFG